MRKGGQRLEIIKTSQSWTPTEKNVTWISFPPPPPLTNVSLLGHLTYGLINIFEAEWLTVHFGSYPSRHSSRFPWGKGYRPMSLILC
jgi:hypothetical protein